MKRDCQQLWLNIKKSSFHHNVKNFYYKNIFRKIYTVTIIWLILANIFSLFKYQSFANELEWFEYMSNVEEWTEISFKTEEAIDDEITMDFLTENWDLKDEVESQSDDEDNSWNIEEEYNSWNDEGDGS